MIFMLDVMINSIRAKVKGCPNFFLRKLTNYTNIFKKQRIQKILLDFPQPYKLHLGCGGVKFENWINIDQSPYVANIVWNLANGIPFQDNSCQLIYHEHLLEHLCIEDGVSFLKECYRVLQTGGVMRVAMPSLDVLIEKYYHGNWQDQDWLNLKEYKFIKTRSEMLNIAFRWWGHQWLYDREELHRRLQEAGFTIIKDVEWGNSNISELNNRETRKDSLLICEAYK